ncbi:MAG: hypothetical protein H6573_23250 [Lewinellaceae bacterium]|nr:hypothetical protein [Lewinellaceae bacterium]
MKNLFSCFLTYFVIFLFTGMLFAQEPKFEWTNTVGETESAMERIPTNDSPGNNPVSELSSCDGPALAADFYRLDAKIIAADLMANDPAYETTVNIPPALEASTLDALVAIFNTEGIGERDTVVECLNIHNNLWLSQGGIEVFTNTNVNWANELINGIFPTSNTQVNNLFDLHDLSLSDHYELNNEFGLNLQSSEIINLNGLANLFQQIPSVNDAYAQYIIPFCATDHIYIERFTGYKLVHFFHAIPCVDGRSWTFRVNDDCSVAFINSNGPDDASAEIECNEVYQCFSDPLSLDWLQNIISDNYWHCGVACLGSAGLEVYRHTDTWGATVIEIRRSCSDVHRDFYYCDGTQFYSCLFYSPTEIPDCDDNITNGLNNTVLIWDCSIPQPQGCPTTPDEILCLGWIQDLLGSNSSASLSYIDLNGTIYYALQTTPTEITLYDCEGNLIENCYDILEPVQDPPCEYNCFDNGLFFDCSVLVPVYSPNDPFPDCINDCIYQTKITATDVGDGSQFGRGVSISGNHAVIGAPYGNNRRGSAYFLVREGNNWVHQTKVEGSDGFGGSPSYFDHFGESVSIDGNYAVIGAPGDDSDKGSAYIFVQNGNDWVEQAKLTASDRGTNDRFGGSVSISGDYVIVGADKENGHRGAAYIFTRNGSSWVQQAKLTAPDGAPNDFFGGSVSIDGDYTIISAEGNNDRGAAYIFARNGSNWIQQTKLIASNGASGDRFGAFNGVDIFEDYAIAGATGVDNGDGAVYIFRRDGNSWIEETTINLPANARHFGHSVKIQNDRVLVGALLGETNLYGSSYVFMKTSNGWEFITGLSPESSGTPYFFGASIDLDGDFAIISAFLDDSQGLYSGSSFIFNLNCTDRSSCPTSPDEILCLDWVQNIISNDLNYLNPCDPNSLFGYGVSIYENNGEKIIVIGSGGYDSWYFSYYSCSGAFLGTSTFNGADITYNPAYLENFNFSESVWDCSQPLPNCQLPCEFETQITKPDETFGGAVSIDGNYSLVGAYGEITSTGAAYIYMKTGANWLEHQKLIASDGVSGDRFGGSVSMANNYAAIGADGKNDNEGAVYVFENNGYSWVQQAILTASDGASGNRFGLSVFIDGNNIAVGTENNAVYVFKRSGNNWMEQAKITASDGAPSGCFGCSVYIKEDYLVCGSPGYSFDDEGSAYVFQRAGDIWNEEAKLTASDGANYNNFGAGVAMNGEYIAIGAPNHSFNGQEGSVYVFQKTGDSWIEKQKLVAPSEDLYSAGMGLSVSMNNRWLAAGGFFGEGIANGTVNVFELNGDSWEFKTKLYNDLFYDDNETNDFNSPYGFRTVISGNNIIVGAPREDELGSSFIYNLDCINNTCQIEPNDVLCLDWIRDTINYYRPDPIFCDPENLVGYYVYYISLASYNENTLIVLSESLFPDAGNSRYYSCDGTFIGTSSFNFWFPVTFNPPYLENYSRDIPLWHCSQPLPSCTCTEFPNWTALPTGNPHTVIINPEAANCSAIGGLPLEPCDYIGFFYTDNNGELACSNFGEWTGEPLQIPVYGNDAFPPEKNGFADGESFTVKVWKQSTGEEYTVQATYQPIGSMADIGGASIPVTDQGEFAFLGTSAISCLETERCLTIDLSPGVNFVSSYIVPDEANLGQIMQSAADAITIVKTDNPQLHWSPGFNDPFDWEVAEGYRIQAHSAASFDICGQPADPANTPIEVETSRGWHFISYLRSTPANVHQQLEPHLSLIGQVRNSLGITYAGQSPGPFDMQPGQGYYLYPAADGSFHYNGSGRPNPGPPTNGPALARSNTHFHQPMYNSGIDASLLMPASVLEDVIQEGDEVAVTRADGQVVGAAAYEGKNFIISLWGDAPETAEAEGLARGETFYLKVWKEAAEQEYETQFTLVEQPPIFQKDAIYWLGSLTLLQPVSAPQTVIEPPMLNLFPNPVKAELFIEFRRPVLQVGQLQVISSNGALMETAEIFPGSTLRMVFTTQHLAPGAYFFRFILNGKAETHRVAVIH